MIDEHYPLLPFDDDHVFPFFSSGKHGKILKLVVFSQTRTGKWNLAFGDFNGLRLDDSIVSNNQDLPLVIKTVVAAAYRFSEKFPDRVIYIEAIDKRRNLLYHRVLRTHFEEISEVFFVEGRIEGRWVSYRPRLDFEAFQFTRKPYF
ncbi:MAG: DUF6934 family protein [Saprospiraceae bacterium]